MYQLSPVRNDGVRLCLRAQQNYDLLPVTVTTFEASWIETRRVLALDTCVKPVTLRSHFWLYNV
jgi:hypothetical protein